MKSENTPVRGKIEFNCPNCKKNLEFNYTIGQLDTLRDELFCRFCKADVKREFLQEVLQSDIEKHENNRKKILLMLGLNILILIFLVLYLYFSWGNVVFGIVLLLINLIILLFALYFFAQANRIIQHLKHLQETYGLR